MKMLTKTPYLVLSLSHRTEHVFGLLWAEGYTLACDNSYAFKALGECRVNVIGHGEWCIANGFLSTYCSDAKMVLRAFRFNPEDISI